LTGLYLCVLQIKTKHVSCPTADSKPVKQEVNGTAILPPLRIPWLSLLDAVAAQILTIKVGTSTDPGCLHLFWFSYLCQLLEFALDEEDYLQTNTPSAIFFS
jgi:hypothetical protein